jgi:Zn-finger nucleic acid-binding protein
MHTYNRNGIQIEQCGGCRGIFLDYGELESLTRLESQWSQPAPPPQAYPAAPGPAWGHHDGGHGHYGHHGHQRKGFGHLLFSS